MHWIIPAALGFVVGMVVGPFFWNWFSTHVIGDI